MFVLFPAGLEKNNFCDPYAPFKCPSEHACISIQYLCDGAADCPDAYDEDPRLCTAGMVNIRFNAKEKRQS